MMLTALGVVALRGADPAPETDTDKVKGVRCGCGL